MSELDYRALVLSGRPALRARHLETPFLPEQIQALKAMAREMGKCGSLDTPDGLPCFATPRIGFTVCVYHGADAPMTVRKAHQALMETTRPGLRFLQEEWERLDHERCPTCGFPSASLKEKKHYAALLYKTLDRVGLGPGKTLNVNVGQSQESDALIELATPEERAELREYMVPILKWRERMRARMTRPPVVVEGEVVRVGGEGGTAQRSDRPGLDAWHGQDLERRDREPGHEG